MSDPYSDLYYETGYERRTSSFCKICNNTGSVTAMHRQSKSIYEFMCSCPKGYETHKNPPKSPVKIAPEWEKAVWNPSLSKNFMIYDINLLPTIEEKKGG